MKSLAERIEEIIDNKFGEIDQYEAVFNLINQEIKAVLEELENIKNNLISKGASIQPNWLIRETQKENARLKAQLAEKDKLLAVFEYALELHAPTHKLLEDKGE